MKDEMPRKIWTIQDYHQAKEFYEKRGMVFNPALEKGSPAAHHAIVQGQLQALQRSVNAEAKVAEGGDTPKRFRVAFSFPGEHRDRVENIVLILAKNIGKEKIFYDNVYLPELARINLDTHLQDIYRNNSDLIVVFICKEYQDKKWCGVEWRAIRDLINDRKSEHAVMPFKIGDGDFEIPGLLPNDGYINAERYPDNEVAQFVVERLRSNDRITK